MRKFIRDTGQRGLDTVELVMLCEERFAISISDSDAEKLGTPEQTADLIQETLKESGTPVDRVVIDSFLEQILCDEFGVSRETFSKTGHYVRDFGLD